ncbi:GNAT family N-acetyltransferase [Actinophytocola sp.]|uniref:GNAT family N-acetyltransferase n=1 Tax=Actinophytocola sp. TaxID=1872138 RepID=UPI003D6BEC72
MLDERAGQAAASLLEPLSAEQRARLIKAMREVDRLLTAAEVTIEPVDPDHEHARYCRNAYYAEICRRFEQGFDPDAGIPAEGDRCARRPVCCSWSTCVGCRSAAARCGSPPGEPAHFRRMWVDDSARGLGIGRRLLVELESRAAAHGCDTVALETNRALTEAIAMYRSAGYVEVEPFNDEVHAHRWFTKRLGTRPSAASRS